MPPLRITAVALLLALPTLAHAQSPAPEAAPIDEARAAFVSGTELAKQERWQDALEAFERSAHLRPHPVTTYNIAYCERALGHYARAWHLFSVALGGALPPDLERSARAYHDEAGSRIARAAVTIPSGARLGVDGKSLDAVGPDTFAPSDRAGDAKALPVRFLLVLDPGEHTFTLSESGKKMTRVRRTLASGDNSAIALELEPDPSPRRAPAPATHALEAPTERAPPRAARSYTLPIVAFGIGAAGIGVGTFFGIRALRDSAALANACPDKTCPPEDSSRIDSAARDSLISDIGFAVGVAGAGAGVILLLGDNTSSPAAAARVTPWLGVGAVGARGRF